jgi:cyclopropane-fatty-acyl-phospholipid synthase
MTRINLIELCEQRLIPDVITRWGIRRLLAERLREERLQDIEAQLRQLRQRIADWRNGPLAIATDKANEQHYEVPSEFFFEVLGPHLKYSACYWPQNQHVVTLAQAEQASLRQVCERALLEDGMNILELGCGWGSLTLWMAQQYPGSRITALSNSASQRLFIEQQCRQRGLTNVQIITCDIRDFQTRERFERIVSIEMFEHIRNHEQLMQRIAGWLQPGGRLFVHIFCHRELAYPFEAKTASDWMSRYFFTGGVMPSEYLLLNYQKHLALEDQWRLSGLHYQRTLKCSQQNLDLKNERIDRILGTVYGAGAAKLWRQRWRMFFMACAELFAFDNGRQWFVAHYRFSKR